MTFFHNWCIRNSVYTQKSSECTHLLLNGGKLCVKASQMDSFLQAYVKSLQNNDELYIVERVSKEIRLFLDIDTKSSNLDCDLLVRRIHKLLPVEKLEYKCNKTNGYHIIFSDCIVTPNAAHTTVVALQEKLAQLYCYDMNELRSTIDLSVYKTGLRMIGSYKKNDLRCYLPHQKNRVSLDIDDICQSLIRHSHDLPEVSKQAQSLSTKTEPIMKEIMRLNSNFRNFRITKISKLGDTFCIYTDSHFCMNKGDFHSKEIVYFIVTKDKKISQKCFCSNSIKRQHGLCSNYKSSPSSFSHRAYYILNQSK